MSADREQEGLKYGVADSANTAETLVFSAPGLGQRNPQHCPHLTDADTALRSSPAVLGEPLSIHDVAALLGCSPWTVRQRYVRQGLPHLQARARGKLIFFREQVIAWIEKRQRQKGGNTR